MSNIVEIESSYLFDCPHCNGTIEVKKNEINCCIFRHGIFKSTGQPVNPHMPKAQCERLVINDIVYGCCKPFQFFPNEKMIKPCDYI